MFRVVTMWMAVRAAAALAAAICVVGGCARYEAKPLDLEAHRAAWLERSADDAEVMTFAARLAEAGGSTMEEAGGFDPSDGLSLAEAEVVALVFNPELRVARLRVNVSRATAEHAGLWEDPVFDFDVLKIVESVPDPWIAGASLGFTIPLSGRLEAEKARASAEHAAEIARAAQREWEVVIELREMWAEWSAANYQVEVAAELVERLESIVGTMNRLEQVGEVPLIESRLFAIEASSRSSSARELAARAARLELQIKGLLGLRPESPVTLAPSLSVESEMLIDEMELARRNAALAVSRSEYEVAEQSLRREIRKQYPDLTIGPAYENEEDQSRIGLGGSLPIPVLNRNRQGIAEAEAQREAARAAHESLYEQVVHEFARAQMEARQQRDIHEHFEAEVIPLVEAQARDARRMIELGEIDTLVQLESMIGLAEAKLRLVEIRAAEAQAANRLASIAGPPTRAEARAGGEP